ncbi:putative uncharacterized protein LOC105043418 isoform X1 [Chlorella sorokiniana]|uniref:Uncharacterized protein n=1 Tax=Chlorella sorokiniana TaxID=3076 RepID=A0A2P6TT31_CHLSO|nr:putative uncharacterized protein LOC105043418 isoform X1 [Chlorella sorokiniana]|eukprot:PRW57222.1 putative uncharacterized protein LOC105043418 isoform X1 [Chlorella sorokiniana]
MLTPLELRNAKREAQRAVRLAVNAIHSSLDAWKAAVSDGKAAATTLTNAALTQLHLPALPLVLLGDVPGLRPAAEAKLRQQQDEALAALKACLERLHEAVAGLAAAADSLHQLAERDAAAPLLAKAPVFATLPLHLVAAMLAEVHSQHQAELGVKAGVLRGCEQVVGDLRAADRPDGDASSGPGGGVPGSTGGSLRSGGTGRAAAQREEALRRTMQVYLTAWMLSPEVDEGRVEGHLAQLEADMRGF